ncbi:hypothetical protein Nepgr_024820 [Nepenthes gracilis]|uniref:Uncharacterized protein n=1 Tax=Nepenthes gracilis TaxID=150966 RepID=A0AAD3XYZ5_NEPGR|nr:hypothetical protein Nepgr_024820 [Nepenthes gracilis]
MKLATDLRYSAPKHCLCPNGKANEESSAAPIDNLLGRQGGAIELDQSPSFGAVTEATSNSLPTELGKPAHANSPCIINDSARLRVVLRDPKPKCSVQDQSSSAAYAANAPVANVIADNAAFCNEFHNCPAKEESISSGSVQPPEAGSNCTSLEKTHTGGKGISPLILEEVGMKRMGEATQPAENRMPPSKVKALKSILKKSKGPKRSDKQLHRRTL